MASLAIKPGVFNLERQVRPSKAKSDFNMRSEPSAGTGCGHRTSRPAWLVASDLDRQS